jgi:hypothetical protein
MKPLPGHEPRMYLRTLGYSLTYGAVRSDEHFAALAADDAAWCFEYEAWQRSRPSKFRKHAYQRWQAESCWLEFDRSRIILRAHELGLRTPGSDGEHHHS